MKEVNKVSKRVGAYLHASRPLSFEGEVLRVSTQSDFHARQMKEEKNKRVLADGIYNALGVKVQIEFTHAGADGVPVAEEEPVVESERVQDVEESTSVEPDDPVELIKRGLGGEVVEERSNQGAR